MNIYLPFPTVRHHSDRSGALTLPEYVCAACNELMKNGWRMKEIDEMDIPGFLRLRAWDAGGNMKRKPPRQHFIDEVRPGVKPQNLFIPEKLIQRSIQRFADCNA